MVFLKTSPPLAEAAGCAQEAAAPLAAAGEHGAGSDMGIAALDPHVHFTLDHK